MWLEWSNEKSELLAAGERAVGLVGGVDESELAIDSMDWIGDTLFTDQGPTVEEWTIEVGHELRNALKTIENLQNTGNLASSPRIESASKETTTKTTTTSSLSFSSSSSSSLTTASVSTSSSGQTRVTSARVTPTSTSSATGSKYESAFPSLEESVQQSSNGHAKPRRITPTPVRVGGVTVQPPWPKLSEPRRDKTKGKAEGEGALGLREELKKSRSQAELRVEIGGDNGLRWLHRVGRMWGRGVRDGLRKGRRRALGVMFGLVLGNKVGLAHVPAEGLRGVAVAVGAILEISELVKGFGGELVSNVVGSEAMEVFSGSEQRQVLHVVEPPSSGVSPGLIAPPRGSSGLIEKQDEENRHAWKTPAGIAQFNNRQKVRDALFRIVGGKQRDFAAEARNLVSVVLLPGNIGWFAGIVVQGLLDAVRQRDESSGAKRMRKLEGRLMGQRGEDDGAAIWWSLVDAVTDWSFRLALLGAAQDALVNTVGGGGEGLVLSDVYGAAVRSEDHAVGARVAAARGLGRLIGRLLHGNVGSGEFESVFGHGGCHRLFPVWELLEDGVNGRRTALVWPAVAAYVRVVVDSGGARWIDLMEGVAGFALAVRDEHLAGASAIVGLVIRLEAERVLEGMLEGTGELTVLRWKELIQRQQGVQWEGEPPVDSLPVMPVLDEVMVGAPVAVEPGLRLRNGGVGGEGAGAVRKIKPIKVGPALEDWFFRSHGELGRASKAVSGLVLDAVVADVVKETLWIPPIAGWSDGVNPEVLVAGAVERALGGALSEVERRVRRTLPALVHASVPDPVMAVAIEGTVKGVRTALAGALSAGLLGPARRAMEVRRGMEGFQVPNGGGLLRLRMYGSDERAVLGAIGGAVKSWIDEGSFEAGVDAVIALREWMEWSPRVWKDLEHSIQKHCLDAGAEWAEQVGWIVGELRRV